MIALTLGGGGAKESGNGGGTHTSSRFRIPPPARPSFLCDLVVLNVPPEESDGGGEVCFRIFSGEGGGLPFRIRGVESELSNDLTGRGGGRDGIA